METGSPGAQPASRWSDAQIATVALLAIAVCVTLVAGVIIILMSRGRSREMEAKVDSAVAELGIQKTRAELLEKKLTRRDVFISRNTLRGPEAYSAPAPEVHSDPFVVGSDDESDSSDSGGSLKSSQSRWAARPRRAVSATPVQPNEIKPITLLSRVRSRDGNLGTAIVDQSLELSRDGSLDWVMVEEESPKNRRTGNVSPGQDSTHQIARCWNEDRTNSAKGDPPSQS